METLSILCLLHGFRAMREAIVLGRIVYVAMKVVEKLWAYRSVEEEWIMLQEEFQTVFDTQHHWTACTLNKTFPRLNKASKSHFSLLKTQTCISKVYDVWARSLLISTIVSFNPCLPETNDTLSSHGWHARRSLLWHLRHKTLYVRSSRCPVSRGGCHSSCTDVWLTTETTLRGAEGTPGERWWGG